MKRRMLIEVVVCFFSILPGVYLYQQPSSEQFGILVGLLIYIAVTVVRVEWSTTNLANTARVEEELTSLNEHLHKAKNLGSPVHVFLDWARCEITALETRFAEIAEESFTVHDGDLIDMERLYAHAFRVPSHFSATCPEQAVDYLVSEAGRVFLGTLWRNTNIQTIRRLFIVGEEFVKTPKFKALTRFHNNAGWEWRWTTPERFNAMLEQLGGVSAPMGSHNFSTYGTSFTCEAVRPLERRMKVIFRSNRSKVSAYCNLFDRVWNDATAGAAMQREANSSFDQEFTTLERSLV